MIAERGLRTDRWQPVRGGLINLFKYQDQVFEYEGGRLLLRGDNGSGKSRVLALQLPFLLDGDLSPYRVEPDRDPAKRMEWNLLMDRHERRLGYTWIEFGREVDGEARYITLGCGLEARKGGGSPKKWFFITGRRVRVDFDLISNRAPLGKRLLIDTLADLGDGTVYETMKAYRDEVDKRLFRLGDRYLPLIDLLIQLRQPQLMRDMKEDVLSHALSEALAPVEEGLIAQVAESFQGLESDRERTEAYRETLHHVEMFREGYTQYLATAIRRLCEVVRRSQSQYETTARNLRSIDEELAKNQEELTQQEASRGNKGDELAGLLRQIDVLRESPEMRSKRDLDTALREADRTAKEAREAEVELRGAEGKQQAAATEEAERRARREEAMEGLQRDSRRLQGAHETIAARSDKWELGEINAANVAGSDPSAEGVDGADGALRQRFEALVKRRKQAVRQLETRNQELQRAGEALARAQDRVETARERFLSAGEATATEKTGRVAALDDFAKAAREWEKGLEVLEADAFAREQDWRSVVEEWLEAREGASPFETAVGEARRRVADALADQRANLEQLRRGVDVEVAGLEDELQRLREGEVLHPPARHTRDDRERSDQEDRPGFPFWQGLDFRDRVPVGERAGWEAALEASGLLDAWVLPDAAKTDGWQDDFLRIGADPELPAEQSLAAVLKSAGEEEELVTALLRRIGNHPGAARCWMALDGTWANGPHGGRWSKAHVEFVGHRAREEARARRITECESRLRELAEERDSLAARLAALADKGRRLAVEADHAPSTREVVEKTIRHEQALEHERECKRLLGEAEAVELAATQQRQAAFDRREADARDLDLTEVAEPAALRDFETRLNAFELQASAFLSAWVQARQVEREWSLAVERLRDAEAVLTRTRTGFEARRTRAAEARAVADTLQATLGAGVQEVMANLRAAEAGKARCQQEVNGLDSSIKALEIGAASLRERRKSAEEKRANATGERDQAVARMEVFVAERLFEEVDPESQPAREPFSTKAAVDLARHFEKRLKSHGLSEERWHQLGSELITSYGEFSEELGRHGYIPQLNPVGAEGVSVIKCEFKGQLCPVGEFSKLLGAELESRERFFKEREREVIENHLIGEAAHALQQRIREGEDWVVKVNEELKGIQTSSGIQLRFKWQISAAEEDALKPVRDLFLRMSAAWSPGDRHRIGDFLQRRIAAAREADDTANWRDYLRQALDYREWHRFGIERKQEGDATWKRLTKRTFGTGSGGEKAMTLTVPQFAAAAAHYQSADPAAPRLILLDEVFAGIDEPTRARLMGLLATFDLDYVMTSQLEWGTYPTVDALAIYHLVSRPGSPAVSAIRWVWNGREKRRD